MTGTTNPDPISTRLRQIAELARSKPHLVFTGLNHHLDAELLMEAYRRTRKSGAVGIDGETAEMYAKNLEANLQALATRVHTGQYRAPPVRRVHIPKGDGSQTRPIGIPTFEDKVLQRAVAMLLEAVYEQDFLDCSFGFRPGRSPHDALDALRAGAMQMGGGWVIDADIKAFFDTLDHKRLNELLDRRVRDGVLRRLIQKWLHAGVLDEGTVIHPEAGTPQGGVISPLLANIYLHEVLDTWFHTEVTPRLRGQAILIRYADDFVVVCAEEADARKVLEVLPKRFEKYNLVLHPDKTRLVPFRRPPFPWEEGPPPTGGGTGPGSYDLLGFTHYWGRTRKGGWAILWKTAKSRFTRALRSIAEWMKRNRHQPVPVQHKTLEQKLRGHYNYYGVTCNGRALQRFAFEVTRRWKKWLGRRSQRAYLSKDRFKVLMARFPLPQPRLTRSIYRQAANP